MAGVAEAGGAARLLADRPMTSYQWFVVAISVILNALDGFDVLAITFAAPGIAADWGVRPAALGVVISTGLVGMVLGSVFIAPLADRLGRRPVVLLCLPLMGGGMLLTATANSVEVLAFWRVITGLGIGGMIAAITAVAAEFANEKRRDFCVSVMTVGYPLGGVLGGLMSAGLVERYGWEAIFVAGGALTLAFLPVVWFGLPESVEYLQAKGDRAGVARVLKRLGIADAELPPPRPPAPRPSPAALFAPGQRTRTLRLVAGYFLHILAFYFVAGWLPKIMTDRGFSMAEAINTATVMNVGGIIGGAIIGWLAPTLGLKRLALGAMAGTSVMMAAFGLLSGGLGFQRMLAFVLGIAVFGGIVGLYSFLARAFPPELRVTGAGLTIAFGRGGAVLGPILGGVLLEAGLAAGTALMVVGGVSLAGAAALAPLRIGPEPAR